MPREEVIEAKLNHSDQNMKLKERKAVKNLNRLLYEESQLENSNKLPLQEIEENSFVPLEEDRFKDIPSKFSFIGRKKIRKNKSAAISDSPHSKLTHNSVKPNNINENASHKLEPHSSATLSELMKSNKVPISFSKITNNQEDLRNAINKTRQSFAGYKLTSFFCFNSEFIKEFGENLIKAEQCVQNMDSILEKAILREIMKSCEPTNEDIEIIEREKTDVGSLTPPSSEIGMNDSKTILETTNPKKKRKFGNSQLGRMKTLEKNVNERSTRKLRKCTVSRPLASKIIIDNNEINDKAKVSNANDDQVHSDTDTQEEYEVRKIQDYIKKQGNYYYRVSWRGYESDEDTFEPADHLGGCDEVLTDFFYQRLKSRETITHAEQLKSLFLPTDEKVKELLYKAFEKLVDPISEATRKEGIRLVTSFKGAFRSKGDIQEEILKFLGLRDPALDRYKKSYTSIIEQISYREIYQERQKQLADLRAWERSMNIISSDSAPLYVENNNDLTLPPLDFVYINEYVPGQNIIIPNDPVAGCECKECNSLQKSCCASQMCSYFAYNKNGRLRVSLGTPIYECNKACKCPSECTNRVVQNGRKVSLAIFRTTNQRGWGVKALEPIKKDQFVSEYVGEVISSDEAEQRGMKYDTKGCTYLFDLDYNKGDQNPYTVDAAKYGNVSHFINHSCDPNLVVFNVWVNCLDPDLPKLALFAARDIKKGEEITFDYNSGSTRQISIMDKIDEGDSMSVTPTKQQSEDGTTIIPTTEFIRKTPRNRGLNGGKTVCRCGAPNCRKYFF